MPSKWAVYRENLKKNHPEKYQDRLKKAKERNKRNMDARRERWQSELQTRALLQEIQQHREQQR